MDLPARIGTLSPVVDINPPSGHTSLAQTSAAPPVETSGERAIQQGNSPAVLVALRTRQVLFAEEVNPTVQQPVDEEEDLDELLAKMDEEIAPHQRTMEDEPDGVEGQEARESLFPFLSAERLLPTRSFRRCRERPQKP